MEYMHSVMLGVVKLLLTLWTDPTRSRGTLHDIEPHLHLINERIELVQVSVLFQHKNIEVIISLSKGMLAK